MAEAGRSRANIPFLCNANIKKAKSTLVCDYFSKFAHYKNILDLL